MKVEGSRGLMITYDPPGPDAPNNVANPNQFPVNTQEICYINVSFFIFLLIKSFKLNIISIKKKMRFLKCSWPCQVMDNFNLRRAKHN